MYRDSLSDVNYRDVVSDGLKKMFLSELEELLDRYDITISCPSEYIETFDDAYVISGELTLTAPYFTITEQDLLGMA